MTATEVAGSIILTLVVVFCALWTIPRNTPKWKAWAIWALVATLWLMLVKPWGAH